MLRNQDDVIRDGESVRVPLMLCDAAQREIACHVHRPHQVTDASDASQKTEAYERHLSNMQDAWRNPALAPETKGEAPTGDARQQALALRDAALTAAWKEGGAR
ncbi:hypothetical protein AUC71_07745 [Methyloceanibacter marginalis]|uniref:Uncharacterized protein n=1 Tax=Methyloceanibacter marginalis TaxID=1774971 RepID=A0A1E3WDA7_9HYPH|nr:hypothetical protein [Methyloceanibacter marginalis]ODS03789.1 hypothetical protein AUC71_07745 [Methyloceanibacter marginalis]